MTAQYTNSEQAMLTVISSGPDFTIAVMGSPQTTSPGGSATYTISPNPVNGFNAPVSLSLWRTPAGVTATLSSTTISPGQPATLTVSTSGGIAAGSYAVAVAGTSGAATRVAAAQLMIGQGPCGTLDCGPVIGGVVVDDNHMTIVIYGVNFGADGFVQLSGHPCADYQWNSGGGYGPGSVTCEFSNPIPAGYYSVAIFACDLAPAIGGCFESNDASFSVEAEPPPDVTIAMKLEQVGPTVISTDGKYSEDTTIRITAVNATTHQPVTTFTGTVKIAEDGTFEL